MEVRSNAAADIERAHRMAASGDSAEAEALLRGVLALEPDNIDALSALATVALIDGNFLEAKNLLARSVEIAPDQPDTWLHFAATLYRLSDYAAALSALDQAATLAPPTPETWNTRGLALAALNQLEDALSCFDASIELNATSIESRLYRASIIRQLGKTDQAISAYQEILTLDPVHIASHFGLAELLASKGLRELAIAELSKSILIAPDFIDALTFRSRLYFELGSLDKALADIDHALLLQPSRADLLFQKGSVLMQQGNGVEALAYLNKAHAQDSDNAHILLALGIARFYQKDFDGALEAFNATISRSPNIPEAYNNKGLLLQELRRHKEAIDCYDRSLALWPGNSGAIYNKANALREEGRFESALTLYDELLAKFPDHLDGLVNKAATLDKLKRTDEALDIYKLVIKKYPADPGAYFDTSRLLAKLNKLELAIGYANKALKLDPDNVNALYIRAQALMKLGLIPHAMMDTERALQLNPHHALSNFMMGSLNEELKRTSESLAYLEAAAAEDNSIDFLLGKIAHQRMHQSNWKDLHSITSLILERLDAQKLACQPFDLHSLADTPEHHKKCAELYYDKLYRTPPAFFSAHARKARIHVAYFSSDIGDHPVSHLMAGVFETHDREQFEVTLFLLNNHSGAARDRICNACERVINAEFMTDEEIASLSRNLNVDIAVDLNGYTSKNRTGIFARRAAPLQINYIGFLGTMGSDCHDYIIGDSVISPLEHESDFSEKIIQLPCYQANDDKIAIPQKAYNRADFCLPDDAFVFCSFNANYKVTPYMFAAWMSILAKVPNSVLWLFCRSDTALANLRSAAENHGIAGERLILASRLPYLEHLSRHCLGDVFLDTHPYNAGATASNALYAGLPIVTYAGKAFCSRYGASLLTALNLPELITYSIEDYIALSVRLASTPAYHTEIKTKLKQHIRTMPLFNTKQFTEYLERAYQKISERHAKGLPPSHISTAELQ